jgi:hypothetical protein
MAGCQVAVGDAVPVEGGGVAGDADVVGAVGVPVTVAVAVPAGDAGKGAQAKAVTPPVTVTGVVLVPAEMVRDLPGESAMTVTPVSSACQVPGP